MQLHALIPHQRDALLLLALKRSHRRRSCPLCNRLRLAHVQQHLLLLRSLACPKDAAVLRPAVTTVLTLLPPHAASAVDAEHRGALHVLIFIFVLLAFVQGVLILCLLKLLWQAPLLILAICSIGTRVSGHASIHLHAISFPLVPGQQFLLAAGALVVQLYCRTPGMPHSLLRSLLSRQLLLLLLQLALLTARVWVVQGWPCVNFARHCGQRRRLHPCSSS
mmetsp:Transcript_4558/g.12456  ORF Transcript_4558/g.12456 Transcript_4558/m.12456 type:complete len:221 (-) Transcript_4558:118-780(-)